MISNIGSSTTTLSSSSSADTATTSSPLPVAVVSANSDAKTVSATDNSTVSISPLARLLADSAARAQVRDSTLSRLELADKAKNLLAQIEGDAYFLNKAKNDSEVPKTDAPALLALAKQATAYTQSNNPSGVKNPFSGLSNSQLSNIIYDDSGTFTVNERRAASYEADIRDEAWRVKVCAQAIDEYNRTGKMTNFFTAVLDHFKGLPAIEQAQYPANYASDLTNKINLDFNYLTNTPGGKGLDSTGLLNEIMKSLKTNNFTVGTPSNAVNSADQITISAAALKLSGQA